MSYGETQLIKKFDMDWIQGQKFWDSAELVYTPKDTKPDDYSKVPNTFDEKHLKDVNIVYTHTIYVKNLFDILDRLNEKFVVVSHNGDVNIDDSYEAPDNVIRWFSQNVNTRKDYLESIPIGLENDMWFSNINKKTKMLVKLQSDKKYKNLVYMNHNIATNPAKRTYPYDCLQGKSWVTTERGTNGTNFDGYLDNIYNHKFVICPEGNGIDTHRIWETLYMGSIPIVENNINNSFYHDLPILPIDDWGDLTEGWLNDAYREMQRMPINKNKLMFSYWKNKIFSYD
jgi:hypothetical protein